VRLGVVTFSEMAHEMGELQGKLREREETLREREETLRERDMAVTTLLDLVKSHEGKLSALQSTLLATIAENELLKRKLYGTKSERTNTSEFQLVIAGLFPENEALRDALTAALTPGDSGNGGGDDGDEKTGRDEKEKKPRATPKGRRDLSASDLPKVVCKIEDEELAQQGRRIKYDSTYELLHLRGGLRVLEKQTAVYEIEVAGEKTVLAAQQPQRLFPRSLCHTSVYAWLAVEKFVLGVPCYRLEQSLAAEAESLDRGTMCRYLEDLGSTLAGTIVKAMFRDARDNCRVLSTDATGAAIQPGSSADGRRQACKKGHFFTIVADCDHVLFHYVESHSSDAVKKIFEGFAGHLQSDASAVYNVLDWGAPTLLLDVDALDADEKAGRLRLVGCWAHCRRYFFEAAITKHRSGLEGLAKIREMFRIDAQFKKLPPRERKRRREVELAPLMDDFFAWVEQARRTEIGRTKASKALGYAHNQEHELRRVLEDGRLALDNTRSERALRPLVVGRKNWLFYGSDVHAQSAAAIFSIISSCRLHRIDVYAYLADVLRVLPYWPEDRMIELAPKYWVATRGRLADAELAEPVGNITVPPPPPD
jgi:transposase